MTLLGVLENVFTNQGRQGHESAFFYGGRFMNESLYGQPSLEAFETEVNQPFTAEWLSLAEMQTRKFRLVPDGLENLLQP